MDVYDWNDDTPVTAMGIFPGDDLPLSIAGDEGIVWVCGVIRNLDQVVVRETDLNNASLSFDLYLYIAQVSLFRSVLLWSILLLRSHSFRTSRMPFPHFVSDSRCVDGIGTIPSFNHKSSSTLV